MRKALLPTIIIIATIFLLARLFYLQVIDDSFKLKSDNNAIKIKYVSQLPTHTPSFAFFCNYPDDIKTPYRNYLENKLRENFNFSGVPVRIFFRKK